MADVSIHTGNRELAKLVVSSLTDDVVTITIPDRKTQMPEVLADERTIMSSSLFGGGDKRVLLIGGEKFDAASQKAFIAELEKRDGIDFDLFVQRPSPTTKKYASAHGGLTVHELPQGQAAVEQYVYNILTSNGVIVSKETVKQGVEAGDESSVVSGLSVCVEIWGGSSQPPESELVIEKLASRWKDIGDEVIEAVLAGRPDAVVAAMRDAQFEPMKLHGYVSGVIFRILADLSGGQTYPSTFGDNSDYMIQKSRRWSKRQSNRYNAYTLAEAAHCMSDAYVALTGGAGALVGDEKTLMVYTTRAAKAIAR